MLDQISGITLAETASTSSRKTNELGQEDFLKLLVAQLKNQDPANPADNGEFLGQIAQFSIVSGVDDLGESFDGIASSLFASQSVQASQLVGKEVLVDSNIVARDEEETVSGFVDLPIPASHIRMQFIDEAGSVVKTLSLGDAGVGSHSFEWDGTDEDGTATAPGTFEIRAEGLVNGELQALPVSSFNTVASVLVDRANTRIQLNLAGNQNINFSQVREFK